jgi:hypothetical protein
MTWRATDPSASFETPPRKHDASLAGFSDLVVASDLAEPTTPTRSTGTTKPQAFKQELHDHWRICWRRVITLGHPPVEPSPVKHVVTY